MQRPDLLILPLSGSLPHPHALVDGKKYKKFRKELFRQRQSSRWSPLGRATLLAHAGFRAIQETADILPVLEEHEERCKREENGRRPFGLRQRRTQG
jgi:hypothetical protein